MITQQLLDYVRQQLAVGISRQNLAAALIAEGWPAADVEAAIAAVSGTTPAPAMQTLSVKRRIFHAVAYVLTFAIAYYVIANVFALIAVIYYLVLVWHIASSF